LHLLVRVNAPKFRFIVIIDSKRFKDRARINLRRTSTRWTRWMDIVVVRLLTCQTRHHFLDVELRYGYNVLLLSMAFDNLGRGMFTRYILLLSMTFNDLRYGNIYAIYFASIYAFDNLRHGNAYAIYSALSIAFDNFRHRNAYCMLLRIKENQYRTPLS